MARTALSNSKYRNRLQIIADILFVVGEGAKKTRIMYQANLSYDLLKRYLAETLESGLVSIDKNKKLYFITRKGAAFLEKYQKYSKSRAQLQEQVEGVCEYETTLERMCSNPSDEEK